MINYPLALSTWDEKENDALLEVIDSGFFSMGKKVEEFEKVFAEYVGSKYAVMVNSGSSANLVAVAALFYTAENKLKRGDEVIVPAVSWSTTYFPLAQYGLKIKFVDIDLETLNYDLNALRDAVTDETKMVVAVNLLGNPNDFKVIGEVIDGRDVILLEDNCESMGARFEKKHAGTFGVMGTFSSFFSHHISTMEGGLVVTDDEELYHIMLSLRTHGWTRNLPKENKLCVKSDDPFVESFRFILPGYNMRPLEMSGALGIRQIEKLPEIIRNRRANAEVFQDLFKNHPDVMIQKEIGESSWFGFSLIIRPSSKLTRAELVQKFRDANVECRPIVAGNFTKNEAVKWMDCSTHGELKNAEYLDEHGLFIGNHHVDVKKQLIELVKLLNK